MMRNRYGSGVDSNDVKAIFDNLLRLEIFYKEFNYEEIEEAPAYPVSASCVLNTALQAYFPSPL